MTEDDMKHEQAYWHEYVQHHVPQAYAGMRELLWDYVNAGGTICVVSHSLSPNILRDYRENGLPEPELVYGWEVPKERRKPQPMRFSTSWKSCTLHPARCSCSTI